jgi:hypothetical protein
MIWFERSPMQFWKRDARTIGTHKMSSTPGSILPGGIVLIDEPAHVSVTTFAGNGEVLLTFNARPGGDCGQVIIGLTPNQAMQLVERLQKHNDAVHRAIVQGKGGVRFPDKTEP